MTTFFLIRHGAHLYCGGRLAGRAPDVHLSPLGHEQAEGVAGRLAGFPIRALYCSPMERTRETAAPIAERLGLPAQINEALTELDFGDWTGQSLDSLRDVDRWRQFNTFRSGTRIPNGELMLETQARIVREMERLREVHPDEYVALVSHGDVMKSAVAYYLGVPLDLFLRIEISLASVTVIRIGEYGPRVLTVNNTAEICLRAP